MYWVRSVLMLILVTLLISPLLYELTSGQACDEMELLSYNAFLVSSFHPEERVRRLVEKLNASRAGVVCLQETWFEHDIRKIIEETSSVYPHSWSFLHSLDGTLSRDLEEASNGCRVAEIFAHFNCIKDTCVGDDGIDMSNPLHLITCMLKHCPLDQFLGSRCAECSVVSCLTPSDLLASLQCQANLTSSDVPDCGTWMKKPTRTRGLLMLSRYPLSARNREDFSSSPTLFKRGYLSANIKDIGEMVCTHLTANLGGVYYDVTSGFTSYEEQNLYELRTLLKMYQNVEHAVIMGDLNVGPDLPNKGIVGEFPRNYRELAKFGFQSINAHLEHCTFCKENPLVAARGFNTSFMMDHILLPIRNNRRVNHVGIVFDDCSQKLVSDHYGVKVTFKARR